VPLPENRWAMHGGPCVRSVDRHTQIQTIKRLARKKNEYKMSSKN